MLDAEDPDLALLLGDQLYALGLARLAELGDLEAVAELADLISLVAQAHLREAGGLAAAVWEAGAIAIGWGSAHRHARRTVARPRQDVGLSRHFGARRRNSVRPLSPRGAAEFGDRNL